MRLIRRILALRRSRLDQLDAHRALLDAIRAEVEGVHVPVTIWDQEAQSGPGDRLVRIAALIRAWDQEESP